METAEDCFACFMKQAVTTLRLCTNDQLLRYRLLGEVSGMLSQFPQDAAPPENVVRYYRYISQVTGVADPFLEIKKQANVRALALEDDVRKVISKAADPLETAVRFAVGANVLDSASEKQLDFETTFTKCLSRQFDIDHFSIFKNKIVKKPTILFLNDNCGEIVFDKLLIETLQGMGCKVTAVVRNSPVINDATLEEAEKTGLTTVCKVISNGSDIPGTSLAECSEQFNKLFDEADCIISKGMGNYECLSGIKAPIFYLFTVKCSTVLAHLKVYYPEEKLAIGSPVLLAGREFL